jgi:hypothetical protein
LLGLFLGCAAGVGLLGLRFSARPAISMRQGFALAAVCLVTAALSVLLSPYGGENVTHPLKVVESEVFRQVGEWFPPYRSGQFPNVMRFWIFFAVAVASPPTVLLLRALDSRHLRRETPDPDLPLSRMRRHALKRPKVPAQSRHPSSPSGSPPASLNVALFDIASIGIGLYMAMFARRFAPVLYIMATPAMASLIVWLARPLSAYIRRPGWFATAAGAWIGAVAAVLYTADAAHHELVTEVPSPGSFDLLDRVTCNYKTPLTAIEFLRRNDLTPNVMTEWKVAAAIMFYVPGARVFIDGRAQQVYTEDHFMAYMWLQGVPPAKAEAASAVLDRFKTDMVLLPRWSVVQPLARALSQQSQWSVVLDEPQATIWVRRGSLLMDELARRDRAGALWWPGGSTELPRASQPEAASG